ncbi:hypothetical protein NOVO_05655 [Rickettsiales bacterium Ac37b]|nr:hypothetical protein NOVO_05655 [Rickettsiales bacterium Ac37b]
MILRISRILNKLLKSNKWPVVIQKIEEIRDIRKNIVPVWSKASFIYHNSLEYGMIPENIKIIIDYFVNAKIMYEDLYYSFGGKMRGYFI